MGNEKGRVGETRGKDEMMHLHRHSRGNGGERCRAGIGDGATGVAGQHESTNSKRHWKDHRWDSSAHANGKAGSQARLGKIVQCRGSPRKKKKFALKLRFGVCASPTLQISLSSFSFPVSLEPIRLLQLPCPTADDGRW